MAAITLKSLLRKMFDITPPSEDAIKINRLFTESFVKGIETVENNPEFKVAIQKSQRRQQMRYIGLNRKRDREFKKARIRNGLM